MPMGCGEQTMMFLAPNVYVLQYLLKTGQVTADIESRAYALIQSGEFSLTFFVHRLSNTFASSVKNLLHSTSGEPHVRLGPVVQRPIKVILA